MVIILIGVSGSGKTSIGRALSVLTGYSFLDADDYHSPENIAKMSRGEQLTDADRLPWLSALSQVIASQVQQGEQTIWACSALKKAYRSQLAQANLSSIHFVYIKVAPELLEMQIEQRQGHFMSPKLLLSQLATLEEPTADEATIIPVQTETSPQIIALYIQNKLEHL
ncbi:MAG: gluconokinase [Chamaesiphon sp.]|nr:gluconokinase [Chamaesiphon sp.]